MSEPNYVVFPSLETYKQFEEECYPEKPGYKKEHGFNPLMLEGMIAMYVKGLDNED